MSWSGWNGQIYCYHRRPKKPPPEKAAARKSRRPKKPPPEKPPPEKAARPKKPPPEKPPPEKPPPEKAAARKATRVVQCGGCRPLVLRLRSSLAASSTARTSSAARTFDPLVGDDSRLNFLRKLRMTAPPAFSQCTGFRVRRLVRCPGRSLRMRIHVLASGLDAGHCGHVSVGRMPRSEFRGHDIGEFATDAAWVTIP